MDGKASGAVGDTTVAKWKDGKQAAVGLAFDDSIWSQVDYVIPLLAKNGLVGSFWVNPATNRYGYGLEMWEGRAQELGMELCCHTMNHTGASSYEEADYEIGECARILRSLRPRNPDRTMLFLRGGATEWKTNNEQMAELMKKYALTRGRGGGVDHGGDDKTGDELAGYVKEAETDGKFHCIAFHGVGPQAEWLPTTPEAFEALVRALVKARDRVWNGTCGEIYMYEHERQSARVAVREASGKAVRLELASDEDPVKCDMALTLDTVVPSGWKRCLIRQGDAESVRPVRKGVVRYEAVPGRGEIALSATARSPGSGAKPKPARPAPGRKPYFAGTELSRIAAVPDGKAETVTLPVGVKDASVGFSLRLGKDFTIPEFAKGGGNVLTICQVLDAQDRQSAVVNVYRQGRELFLYVLVRDNKDFHGIPGWPELPAGHLGLKAGREHVLVLRTREGYRDGGAELWLDGKLRCSFMRRDTTGRAARTVSVGVSARPDGTKGGVRITKVRVSGE